MERSFETELMEDPALPEETLRKIYRDLLRVHRGLGHVGAIERAIQRGSRPVRRVLDIGCGDGAVLAELRRRLGVEVIGVDLRPFPSDGVRILEANAVRDTLPEADVAIAICVVHHLRDDEVIDLIRNVGRSCGRFIVLDLVRHPWPRTLFRMFVAPWVNPVNAADGVRSIERSYSPQELAALAERALQGNGGRMRQRVAPLWLRQMLEITYAS